MKRLYKKKYKSSRYSQFIEATVIWLETYLVRSGSLHLGLQVIRKYLTILRTRGKKEAIAYCKGARTSIYQWLAASDISNRLIEPPKRFGVPKALRFLGREVKGPEHYPLIRLVLSALYASRELTLPAVPNVATITSPPTYQELSPPDLGCYITDFWSELGVSLKHRGKVPKVIRWKHFHLTTKTGPNGHALWSALADLYSLPQSLVDSLSRLGGKRLASRMELLRDLKVNNFLHRFFTGTLFGRFRKVSAIESQEGKTREVAIMDYWSQTCLKGLHRYLFGILRRIPQDCTFNQGSFLEKLPSEGQTESSFHSLDLTAATDRFPIEVICLVLTERFGHEYVNDWRNVMVGYPFWTNRFGEVRYAVGNPMGAYSSWNSFALAHHYVVYYCCRKLGRDWRKAQYVILGDDVVIKDDALAGLYKEVLLGLGVEISISKSHTSPYMYEFAKRVVHQGTEITPFPISALWTTRKQKSLMLNVVDSERNKGWCFPDGIPVTLSKLFVLLRLPRRVVWKTERIMVITHRLLQVMRKDESAYTAINAIAELFYTHCGEITEKFCEGLIREITLNTLINSFRRINKSSSGRSLGQVAENLVILITGAVFEPEPVLIDGRDNFTIDPSALIQSVPVLAVYGQIEEKYLKVRKTMVSSDYLLEGDWKTTLTAMQLPESDRVFYMRNQDLMIQASFTLTKAFIKLMEKSREDPHLWFLMYDGDEPDFV